MLKSAQFYLPNPNQAYMINSKCTIFLYLFMLQVKNHGKSFARSFNAIFCFAGKTKKIIEIQAG